MPKESVAESRLDEVPTEVPLALVGASDAATAARLAMSQAAAGRGPVLLTGEIGCRPAEVAHALHAAAAPGSPFITIDCAAAVAADIEHRLFGSGPRRAPQELEMVGAGAAVVAAGSARSTWNTSTSFPPPRSAGLRGFSATAKCGSMAAAPRRGPRFD